MGKRIFLMCLSIVFVLIVAGSLSAEINSEASKLGFGFRPAEAKKLIPGKDYVPGELIVAYNTSNRDVSVQSIIAQIDALSINFGGKRVKEISGALLYKFPSDDVATKAAKLLIQNPNVRYVERNGIIRIPPDPEKQLLEKLTDKKTKVLKEKLTQGFETQAVSSDAATSYQWHLTVIRKTVANTTSTTPPTVAVIDTGVDYTHPDLSGKVILGKNCIDGSMDPFDDNGHGTHVAGIIAAKAGNNQYGEGVCPNCKILAIKVLDSRGIGTSFDIACGMQYAKTASTTPETKVINMSLGGPGYSNLIRDEVTAIKNAGKILVAAAGNSNSTDQYYPAAYPDTAFRVMATEQNDCRTFFSNFSPPSNPTLYNIAAPGYQIPSTLPGARFEVKSGTSMASAIVAGAVALIWGEFPTLTRDQIISRIINNSQTINCGFPGYSTKRIDIQRALTEQTESRTVLGRLLDPFTGKPPVAPLATARVFSGTTQLGSDTISRDGFYEVLLGGTETKGLTLRATKTGYVTSNLRNFNLLTTNITGPFTDAYPRIRANHATITLDWKTLQPAFSDDEDFCSSNCLGWEFDLYIKTPTGSYIYWFNRGSLSQPPYVYFPRNSFLHEPLETVVISPYAADGTYNVFVENFGNNTIWRGNWTGSQASIQVFSGGSQRAIYHNPPATCSDKRFWHVGNIVKSGTNYTWQNVNICTDTMP